ncbi:hypothetical protein JCM8202_004244 [Rhodotorula sphaerocarpa]
MQRIATKRALARPLRLHGQLQQRRTLWQCATYTSPSPSALLDRVRSSRADSPASVAIYALSKNVPQQLVPAFREAVAPSDSETIAVGCLSEVVLSSRSDTAQHELFSLAIARHRPAHESERALPFRSALIGRPNIALGREIKPEHHDDHDQYDSGLEAFLKGGKWGFGERTQEQRFGGQHEIEELKGTDPAHVRELVVLTADRIQPFLAALSGYPQASTVGLVGSSTPFHSVDGSAYSLFYGDEATATGAVGVAVVDSAPKSSEPTPVHLQYGSLAPVGEPYKVTSAQGNIVLSLADQNAARLLLNAVNDLFGTTAGNVPAAQRSHEKEKEFYAAVFTSEPKAPLDLSEAQFVAKIMAGDPSRGAMSVETEEEVREGSYVVFLHQPEASSIAATGGPARPPNQLAVLSVAPSDLAPHRLATECPAEGPVHVEEYFLAASENGVIVAPRPDRTGTTGDAAAQRPPPRLCAIEGTLATLQ